MSGTVTTDHNTGLKSSIVGALIAPFAAIGRFMVFLAEMNPKLRQLNRLGQTSDEALAARGVTRESEMRRIMGVEASL